MSRSAVYSSTFYVQLFCCTEQLYMAFDLIRFTLLCSCPHINSAIRNRATGAVAMEGLVAYGTSDDDDDDDEVRLLRPCLLYRIFLCSDSSCTRRARMDPITRCRCEQIPSSMMMMPSVGMMSAAPRATAFSSAASRMAG